MPDPTHYYSDENGNLDGSDFTADEANLALKLAELHARCAIEAGERPEPDPMRAVLHLAKGMAAIVLRARMGADGQGAARH
ncbi:MAG: hypothetical protein OXI15_14055 [Chromatiales bacterium]|nr:hypothetical protein [Chromatiales bacterium]